ncbi:MAG: radical SAM protein [Chloroflexi bacterium]|jgi:DNA repair photolyase|nr:radical SAM protein [Chloroflexota bacterium]
MIREVKAKTVLQKSKLPESPYCLNPYIGCTHACSYCYARFMRRFTGHQEPWGLFVDAKVNTPDVLSKQLARNTIHGPVLIGSVCDAYQPLEKRYELTRASIQQFVSKGINFSVLTKSSLVLRDIDLLRQGAGFCSVGISLSTLDDSIRRKFEPGTCSVQKRLHALEQLHKEGIRTYLFIGPILPLITNIEAIVAVASQFVDEVWGEALNLRCGNRNDVAQSYAACNLPDEWDKLTRSPKYWRSVAAELENACCRAEVPLVGFYEH